VVQAVAGSNPVVHPSENLVEKSIPRYPATDAAQLSYSGSY
jgi:hypothetical protein